MFLQGHYQNGYVTHDLDQAMGLLGDRYGLKDYTIYEAEMDLTTPMGDKFLSARVALGWAGGLQIELVQPVSGYIDPYLPFLPQDKSDPVPRFHHIAVRRDDLDAMRKEVDHLGLPVSFESEGPGLASVFLDARESLGHFLEYVWATPEGWGMVGWPKDL